MLVKFLGSDSYQSQLLNLRVHKHKHEPTYYRVYSMSVKVNSKDGVKLVNESS